MGRPIRHVARDSRRSIDTGYTATAWGWKTKNFSRHLIPPHTESGRIKKRALVLSALFHFTKGLRRYRPSAMPASLIIFSSSALCAFTNSTFFMLIPSGTFALGICITPAIIAACIYAAVVHT
jgi:hypothetical protein